MERLADTVRRKPLGARKSRLVAFTSFGTADIPPTGTVIA